MSENIPKPSSATPMPARHLTFGPFLLNLQNGTLLRDGDRVRVGRRGISLLAAMVRRSGEILTKTELMNAAWPETAVEESNLSVQIASLRRALGRADGGADWITTVPRVGYGLLDGASAPRDPGSQAASPPSLAVLPFAAFSSDPEQAFFADGLADEIITVLSKQPGLIVIARSSSFARGRAPHDVRRTAEDLGVRFLVEGSVRTSGDRIRVIVQLSDGVAGSHLWAEQYERNLHDIFAVQDDVAQRIVAALNATLKPDEATLWPSTASGGTRSTAAYECLLRGRAMQRGATQNVDVFTRTSELFRRALELDPSYADAYAALGMALAHAYHNRWTDAPEQSLAEAGVMVDRAIALDPASPFTHGVAALVASYRHDFDRWETEVDEALQLSPNFAPALSLRAMLNIHQGAPRSAIRDLERAMRLDPLFGHVYLHHLGMAHLIAGDDRAAAALFEERILLVPGTDTTRACLCAAFGNLGRSQDVQRVWAELVSINPGFSIADWLRRMPFTDVEHRKPLTDGLEAAGLLTSPAAATVGVLR